MSRSESRSALVVELAEGFLERYRRGERPALKEYCDRHPELAAEIREVFPAMAMIEEIALPDEPVTEETSEQRPPEPAPWIQQLGDYRIIRLIGSGGMGMVYEAEQVSLGRHVALKVLPPHLFGDPKQRGRFEREAKAAARLHHTNIVPVFGVGEQDGKAYYVMQFIAGLSLDEVIHELRRLRQAKGAAQTSRPGEPSGLTRRDVTASLMARSLLTGRRDLGAPELVTAAGVAQTALERTIADAPVALDTAPLRSLRPRPRLTGSPDSPPGRHRQWSCPARVVILRAAFQPVHLLAERRADRRPGRRCARLRAQARRAPPRYQARQSAA